MPPLPQRLLCIGSAIVGLVFCIAWVAFALSTPSFETVLPQRSEPRTGLRNLALFDEGLVVRVSSNERFGRHHPAYALDGHPAAMSNQKWLSALGDKAPWLEVRFRAPRSIEHVGLRFTSPHEPHARVPQVYTFTCLKKHGRHKAVTIRNNTEASPTHALPCTQANGVRIDFPPHGRPASDQVRVVEFQVWGQ